MDMTDDRGKLVCSITRSTISFGVDIRIGGMDRIRGKVSYANPITYTEADIGCPVPPAMHLDGPNHEHLLQSLMDELWKLGIRPDELKNVHPLQDREREALQNHISDLRTVALHALKVKR